MQESYQHADRAGMLNVVESAETRPKPSERGTTEAQETRSDATTTRYGGRFTFSPIVTSGPVMSLVPVGLSVCFFATRGER
jgi:hypothetical protein